MRLLARDSLSREEKREKEPFVVSHHSEFPAAGASSDLQPGRI